MSVLNCKGCRNIDRGNFPFGYRHETGKPGIDTEGCGEFDEEAGELLIYFCPVCGEALKMREPKDDV